MVENEIRALVNHLNDLTDYASKWGMGQQNTLQRSHVREANKTLNKINDSLKHIEKGLKILGFLNPTTKTQIENIRRGVKSIRDGTSDAVTILNNLKERANILRQTIRRVA